MEERKIAIPTLTPDDILGETAEKEIINDSEEYVGISDEKKDAVDDVSEKKNEKKSIYDVLEEEIMSSNISDAEKTE